MMCEPQVFGLLEGLSHPFIWVGLAGRVKFASEFERAGGYLKISSLLEHTKFLDFGLQVGKICQEWVSRAIRAKARHITMGHPAHQMPCLVYLNRLSSLEFTSMPTIVVFI